MPRSVHSQKKRCHVAAFSELEDLQCNQALRTPGKSRPAVTFCWARIRAIDSVMVLNTLEWYPPFRPGSDLMQGVFELAAFVGKLVFDANGGICDHPAGYQLFRFQRSKPFGQHSISDVWNRCLEERIPGLSLKEGLDDRTCPTAADELDSAVESRADRRDGLRHEWKFKKTSA